MRARLLAAGLAAALACADPAPPDAPVLVAMIPSQGTSVAPLAVEIAGEHLDARVRTDFASGGGVVDAGYLARLVPVDGGADVDLLDVALTSRRTLRATVPAGVPRGAYDLVVTDPQGRVARLARAFRVVTSAENVATFRVDVLEPPRAGVAFAVSLTAVDAQGLAVDGFDASVAVTDLTGTASPPALGPFVLGRFQAQVTVTALRAGNRLTVSDAFAHAGSSEPFDVVAGPPVAAAFPDAPVTAASGACSPAVQVELRDVLGHPAPAEAPIAAALQSSPPGLALFSDAACASPATSLSFAPGAARSAFHFRAAAPGAIALRVVPAILPSAAQAATVTP
ncbi:MAG TPA: hypothetical protein VFL83_04040 [Anaeromyxobacter sp.]|nr:hypothetical protein [Anaeromyxobacter sp.]